MTRMIRGSVLLAACVGLWSCSSDPTADEAGVPFKIVSLPSVVFVKQDASQLISFQLVDELDGQIPETWTLTSTSPYFTVGIDSSFRPIYNPDGTLTLPDKQTEVRATINATALGIGTFTASAGGKSLDVTVNVVPGALYATFAPANPAPGDTVTMTMPPTLRLSPTSAVTFPGNVNPIIVSRAADSLSLRFISAPTTDTTATVTLVTNSEFPTLPSNTLTTTTKVTGTQSGAWTGSLPATLSTQTPGGPPMQVTLQAPFAFLPTSAFNFPGQNPGFVTFSADSGTANLSVPPNTASPLQVTRVIFRGAPQTQFQYTLTTGTDSIISTVLIPSVPATIDNANPQTAQPVVLTAGAGFNFDAASIPSWPGGGPAVVVSRTATTMTVQPWPGSTGTPTITRVIALSNPLTPITLPSSGVTPLTLQATYAPVAALPGTDAFATAPLVPNNGTFDVGSFGAGADCGLPCQVYKINITAAGAKTFTVAWNNNADLGLYFLNPGLTAYLFGAVCDAHGAGGTAQPETCTVTFPAAGVYYLELDDYSSFYGPPNNVPPTEVGIRVQ